MKELVLYLVLAVAGILCGWGGYVGLIRRNAKTVSAPTKPPFLPPSSRTKRAAELLRLMEMRNVARETSSSSSESDTGSDDDDDSDANTEDSAARSCSEEDEYDKWSDANLKMVLVVQQVVPKPLPRDVASLTAGAAVSLVEHLFAGIQQALGQPVGATAATTMPDTAAMTTNAMEAKADWLEWYLWWSRIGCAKITLKCPDQAAMDAVVKAAEADGLPYVAVGQSPQVAQAMIVAIGPAPSDRLNPITGKLKLFS